MLAFVGRYLSISIAAALLAGCGAAQPPMDAPSFAFVPARQNIQHIVIVIQENRTLNNLFYGFPGAMTVAYGYNSEGQKIALKPVTLATTWDLSHSLSDFLKDCNGSGKVLGTRCLMNGFNHETWSCGASGGPKCPNKNPPYSYVPHSETKPYFFIGKHYVLADQMYASDLDGSSFVSHQYVIAGQAEMSYGSPTGGWGCPDPNSYILTLTRGWRRAGERAAGSEIPLCWSDKTLGDEMDDAGLSWAYYASQYYGDGGLWSAYQNIRQIYNGLDWTKDVISPQTDFFDDVSNGKLRDVSWITPTCENSDHPACGSKTGPSWVASIVNAVGESKYWDSTAIFVFWDEWGGWYDPEAPKKVDYDGLGFRIPMLVVSAYAKQGYVSHTRYEHGSILRFVEDTFGLGHLAASDRRATPPDDAFDFNAPPRKFEIVPADYDVNYFKHQKPDHRIPDAQ
ncbi:MAG TPA: alkaline phosphatase family protein [Candidatus Cybelea sp.]|nr:alkaline phosphatase family protein [Candidatus Cybelea sp.]